MTLIDLTPAAERLADLVRSVPTERLGDPTPCPRYAVGDLVDHIGGLGLAFALAAAKTPVEPGGAGDASRLGDDWRDRIPASLGELATAWADPDAWTGMTRVGGVDLPGGVCGLVALDELVVHGWDLAHALGTSYAASDAELDLLVPHVAGFQGPRDPDGLFGPVVDVDDGAPPLDRLVGLCGRDPGWRAPSRP